MTTRARPRVRILVSACLLGERVRYDGGDARTASDRLARWAEEGRRVPLCPEVEGELPVPRPPAEIDGEGGGAVLRGEARVVDDAGRDVTPHFLTGARRVVHAALDGGVGLAIFKDGSPSCGSAYIYDGSFTGTRRPGRGVTAALLEEHGVPVFSEHQIEEAAACLERMRSRSRRSG